MIQTLTPEEARNAWDCPVARVMAHPGHHERGYCGLGGQP